MPNKSDADGEGKEEDNKDNRCSESKSPPQIDLLWHDHKKRRQGCCCVPGMRADRTRSDLNRADNTTRSISRCIADREFGAMLSCLTYGRLRQTRTIKPSDANKDSRAQRSSTLSRNASRALALRISSIRCGFIFHTPETTSHHAHRTSRRPGPAARVPLTTNPTWDQPAVASVSRLQARRSRPFHARAAGADRQAGPERYAPPPERSRGRPARSLPTRRASPGSP